MFPLQNCRVGSVLVVINCINQLKRIWILEHSKGHVYMKIESLFNRLRRRTLMLVGFKAIYQASKVFYFASES